MMSDFTELRHTCLQSYLGQLNTANTSIVESLSHLPLPLDAVLEIVAELQDPARGLAAIIANLTVLSNPSSLPSPTDINNTVGIDAPAPSNSTISALLAGLLDDTKVCDA